MASHSSDSYGTFNDKVNLISDNEDDDQLAGKMVCRKNMKCS